MTAGYDIATSVAVPALAVRYHVVRLSGGHQHHYVEAGRSTGPTIVFLHGFLDSWTSFEGVLPRLADHFRLLLLDHLGHGASDKPAGGYEVDALAADAVEFIQQVAGQPVTLVGHSLGGIVAQHAAAARPDLVERLALIGTARTAAGNPALAALLAEVEVLEDPVPKAFVEEFQRSTLNKPIPEERFARLIAESLKVPSHVWRLALAGLFQDRGPPAGRIEAPTLIVWGDRDELFDRADQERLRASFGAAKLTIYRNAGHAPHWEEPDAVGADIAAFLA
jgi:pimeloyl-ACP methyl ester carboxylesterase